MKSRVFSQAQSDASSESVGSGKESWSWNLRLTASRCKQSLISAVWSVRPFVSQPGVGMRLQDLHPSIHPPSLSSLSPVQSVSISSPTHSTAKLTPRIFTRPIAPPEFGTVLQFGSICIKLNAHDANSTRSQLQENIRPVAQGVKRPVGFFPATGLRCLDR